MKVVELYIVLAFECLVLQTPHEANFALLLLTDTRASASSILLAYRLFILGSDTTLIAFLEHEYSSEALYFINSDSSCDSEGAVDYKKRPRVCVTHAWLQ